MYITTAGLVLREAQYKESSKMLTVLTAENGKLSVSAKGVMRRNSKNASAAQLLAYSEMTLCEGKGGWTLTESRPLELFVGLREDAALLTLGSYFAELMDALSGEDISGGALLSLGLNALYALSRGLYTPEHIKAAFEMRLMCQEGYEPVLDACPVCGAVPERPVFWPTAGAVTCDTCNPQSGGARMELCPASWKAMRYIAGSEPKKVFSYHLEKEPQRRLSAAAEEYVRVQMEREFGTLRLYRQLG